MFCATSRWLLDMGPWRRKGRVLGVIWTATIGFLWIILVAFKTALGETETWSSFFCWLSRCGLSHLYWFLFKRKKTNQRGGPMDDCYCWTDLICLGDYRGILRTLHHPTFLPELLGGRSRCSPQSEQTVKTQDSRPNTAAHKGKCHSNVWKTFSENGCPRTLKVHTSMAWKIKVLATKKILFANMPWCCTQVFPVHGIPERSVHDGWMPKLRSARSHHNGYQCRNLSQSGSGYRCWAVGRLWQTGGNHWFLPLLWVETWSAKLSTCELPMSKTDHIMDWRFILKDETFRDILWEFWGRTWGSSRTSFGWLLWPPYWLRFWPSLVFHFTTAIPWTWPTTWHSKGG